MMLHADSSARALTHSTPSRLTCYRTECGHVECRTANTVAKRETKRRRHRPDSAAQPALVHTGMVRTHIAELRAAGLGIPEIARRASVPERHLYRIVNGETRRVRLETKDRLLAVHAGELAPSTRVPAGETLARLAELYEDGWTAAEVARAIGVGTWTVQRITPDRAQVTWRLASAIRDLHAEHFPPDVSGPGDPLGELRLLLGDIGDRTWMSDAECRRIDGPVRERVAVFFPSRGDSVEPAKAVCARCPVIERCQEYVRHVDYSGIYSGVYGQLTGAERRAAREQERDQRQEAS